MCWCGSVCALVWECLCVGMVVLVCLCGSAYVLVWYMLYIIYD